MAWAEKDHNAHSVPTPCYVQCRQPADQAAQSHIQPGLQCLPGWGIHASLGNLFQCVTTLCMKNFFLISNLNLPCSSLNPFPLILSLSTLVNVLKGFGHNAVQPLQQLPWTKTMLGNMLTKKRPAVFIRIQTAYESRILSE